MVFTKMRLTLTEFILACKANCLESHSRTGCKECESMITAAEIVQREHIFPLASVYKEAFPTVTYQSESAKKRLLKMPLACIRVGKVSDGTAQLLVMELVTGLDYRKIQQMCAKVKSVSSAAHALSKDEVKRVLSLAQSECEKECLRYAMYKSYGLTPSGARRRFGFERMGERAKDVESCIKVVEEIKLSFEDLAAMRLKALMSSSPLTPVVKGPRMRQHL